MDFHKWVLQSFDAVFYDERIAPFIWLIINGRFKFWMWCQCFSLLFTWLDSMETWNFIRRKKNYTLFRNIYTINTTILLFCSYFCMYVYIYVYIFMFNCTCPPFYFFFEIFGIFFIRNNLYFWFNHNDNDLPEWTWFWFSVENMTMSVAKIKQNMLYRIYPKYLHINNNYYKLNWIFSCTEMV